jgi:hypothetical protein
MNGVVISVHRNASNNSRFVIEVRECRKIMPMATAANSSKRFTTLWSGSWSSVATNCAKQWSEKVNTVVSNPLPEIGAKQ